MNFKDDKASQVIVKLHDVIVPQHVVVVDSDVEVEHTIHEAVFFFFSIHVSANNVYRVLYNLPFNISMLYIIIN